MTRLEQAGYPSIPGKFGINFEALGLTRTNNARGESGSQIKYKAGTRYIEVQDPFGFHMFAQIQEDDTVVFDLQTRIRGHRHPDMYAGRFQSFAIRNFEADGRNMNYWVSVWEEWSDNYAQFQRAINQGCDALTAARSTWTARSAERNGFYIPRRSSLELEDDYIAVTFSRPI